MIITDVELLVVEKQPGQELVLVVVKTDAGIDGHAMGWGIKGGRRLAEEIQAVLVPEILGEDPVNREHLYHKINQADRWGGHLPITAHGPIDPRTGRWPPYRWRGRPYLEPGVRFRPGGANWRRGRAWPRSPAPGPPLRPPVR